MTRRIVVDEKSILEEIMKQFPFDKKAVEYAFDCTKSFGDTITCLNMACGLATSVYVVADYFRKIREEEKP
jgi:hypothetical protein